MVQRWGDAVHIHKTSVNERHLSLQGVDVCGLRLYREIAHLLREMTSVLRISFIGYSLGGLICRFAAALLYQRGLIGGADRAPGAVRALNFVTIATPHCGIGRSQKECSGRFLNRLLRAAADRLGGRSTLQLALHDAEPNERDPNRAGPLLVRMADPSSAFGAALACFHKRIVYANILNDRTVPFCTASLSDYNPYRMAMRGGACTCARRDLGVDRVMEESGSGPAAECPFVINHTQPDRKGELLENGLSPSEALERLLTAEDAAGGRNWCVRMWRNTKYFCIVTLLLLLLPITTLFLSTMRLWAMRDLERDDDILTEATHRALRASRKKRGKKLSNRKVRHVPQASLDSARFREIALNLRRQAFERVDVYLPVLNAHPVIVARSPLLHSTGLSVVRYLASQFEPMAQDSKEAEHTEQSVLEESTDQERLSPPPRARRRRGRRSTAEATGGPRSTPDGLSPLQGMAASRRRPQTRRGRTRRRKRSGREELASPVLKRIRRRAQGLSATSAAVVAR